MCICGFVCVPLIAWGIGVLGIAGGAGIAEVERAKSAEAEGKGGEGDCGNGEALQELCGTASAASTAGSNGGALLAVVETPKSAEGMCFLCYGMQHECGCESQGQGELGDEAESSSEANC